MSLPLDVDDKQRLLELDDVAERAERIGDLLKHRLETIEFLAPFRREGDPKNN
jgi:Lon protease-like protein